MRPYLQTTILAVLLITLGSGCAVTTADLARSGTPVAQKGRRRYQRFVKRKAPDEEAWVGLIRLAEPYIREGEWDKAAALFEEHRQLFPGYSNRIDAVVDILVAPGEKVSVQNLGAGINTSADEGLPVITADSRHLFFTGRSRADSIGGEDVYLSAFQAGAWQKARSMPRGINTIRDESANSVSADGIRLKLLGNYPGSYGTGDNFQVDKTAQGWGRVSHLTRPINSVYFDSDAFLTADGKAIFFSSDRPGNQGWFHPKDELFHGNYWGNTDIYVSMITDTGYAEPVNLGSIINTPFAERTPFLHPDGKTLYFSSDGHPGLGRLDVFKSSRLSDTSWTAWSEPSNLGKEINTPGDDWGYKVGTSGDKAYFSASGDLKGFGGYDVYSVTLPGAARPEPVATVSGKVADENGNPLTAAIKWENLATGEGVGELGTDPADGSYFIVLPMGINYGYYAWKEGYYPISENIDLRGQSEPVHITEDITLVRIEKIKEEGIPVLINNIFFAFDEFTLRPESFPELNRLADVLKENPEAMVEIAGHTDSIGTNAYNRELSRKRAQSVVSYLISQGIKEVRLKPQGFGEERPVAENRTAEGRKLNRRVEFKFLK